MKVSRCEKNRFCCHCIKEGSKFKFIRSPRESTVKAKFNCEPLNLMYVIICYGCKEEYTGKKEGQ